LRTKADYNAVMLQQSGGYEGASLAASYRNQAAKIMKEAEADLQDGMNPNIVMAQARAKLAIIEGQIAPSTQGQPPGQESIYQARPPGSAGQGMGWSG